MTKWRISERMVADLVILDLCVVSVSLGEGPGGLIEKIQEIVGQGCIKILLSLIDPVYFDSFGLQEITRGFVAVRDAGGILVLCIPTPKARSLFVSTGVSQYIQIFDSEGAAIEGMRAHQV